MTVFLGSHAAADSKAALGAVARHCFAILDTAGHSPGVSACEEPGAGQEQRVKVAKPLDLEVKCNVYAWAL